MDKTVQRLMDVMQDLFDMACNDNLKLVLTSNPDDLDSLYTVEVAYRGVTGVSDPCSSFEEAVEQALDRRHSVGITT